MPPDLLTTRVPLRTGPEIEAVVRRAHGARRAACLLLHGNPGSLRDWAALVPHLPETLDVAAIDLPGFGRSRRLSRAADSMSLPRLAEHAIAAVEALDLAAPLVVIGHSHGGGVAQTVAAMVPERVTGLVLCGTLGAPAHGSYRFLSLPGAEHVARGAGRALQSPRLRAPSRWVLARVMRDIFAPERVPDAKVDEELAHLQAHPDILLSMVHVTRGAPSKRLFDAATRIRCPTLFLHGEHDTLVPPKYARTIHDRIVRANGRSRFELVPRAGHMLIERQASDVAARIVEALPFLLATGP